MDVWVEIPSLVSNHLLVIMVLVWALMAFVALAMMVNQHVNNIEQNLTINEQMNWRRYAYMTQKPPSGLKDDKGAKQSAPGGMSNPFNRGFKMNVVEFFSHSGSSAVDYRNIFTVPSPGDSVSSSVATVELSETSEDIEVKNNAGDVV
ncbi:Palmitoyl transferase [Phytophthora palmivora]|uniref:Palmitoyl transferase n=1 Tax=Phytophthora palmivora TaxID=4796 RepID=A0A2P4Y2X1_9STRA|nr:Palmitoyl transferase [Phytophthora palmivora]